MRLSWKLILKKKIIELGILDFRSSHKNRVSKQGNPFEILLQ
jgi:hypothetical protein